MWATAVKEHESRVKADAEQQILLELVEVKFGLPAQDRRRIKATTDSSKLRQALKKFATASSRQEVLKCLD